MAYTVILKPKAEKELDRLPADLHRRITEKLLALEQQPRPLGVQKLRGNEQYRIRVGDYRILYTIDDGRQWVEIIAIGNRRDVYR